MRLEAVLLALWGATVGTLGATPAFAVESLGARDLAVIVNTADPLSVAIGDYYVKARHIPAGNLVRVRFAYQRDDLPEAEFNSIKETVDGAVGGRVQAYALTWARPYRVGCVSITYAFAAGVNGRLCGDSCGPTPFSSYFNTATSRPYTDLHLHPTMSIAALDFQHAKALIDRGVSADGTVPRGTAYLLATADRARNVRAAVYPKAVFQAEGRINVEVLQSVALENRSDVLFYFIGALAVTALPSNRFVPGAIADHLTSYGGMLTDSSQMSSLRWLEAGATGSYGTVVEPCNHLEKFPDVAVLLSHYLAGETLLEAYWKSVAMPAQGVFIGEPLAAPFGKQKSNLSAH